MTDGQGAASAAPTPRGHARSQISGPSARRAWKNPEVITWTIARIKAGATAEDLIRESAAGTLGWPLSEGGLGQNAAEKCKAIAEDRVEYGRLRPATKTVTTGGKMKRQRYEEIRDRGETRLLRLRVDIADTVMRLEHMQLPEDVGLDDESQEAIAALFDDLSILVAWAEQSLAVTAAQMDDLHRRQKIQKLRARAADPSSAEAERQLARRAAEHLETKRRQLARGAA